jgi:hypothetical protein
MVLFHATCITRGIASSSSFLHPLHRSMKMAEKVARHDHGFPSRTSPPGMDAGIRSALLLLFFPFKHHQNRISSTTTSDSSDQTSSAGVDSIQQFHRVTLLVGSNAAVQMARLASEQAAINGARRPARFEHQYRVPMLYYLIYCHDETDMSGRVCQRRKHAPRASSAT